MKHTYKTQTEKDNSYAHEGVLQRQIANPGLPFKDNRPQHQIHQSLKTAAQNSPQTQQTIQLREMMDQHSESKNTVVPTQPNKTGLPDQLKTGVENLSGYSMDDVKVHRNSPKPAQLQAHAYAQGTDIHLAPGQEKHLPHEAWHVVQQKQGRVKPTMQMKGKVNVNDDAGLEREADVMGGRALNTDEKNHAQIADHNAPIPITNTIQRVISSTEEKGLYYDDATNTEYAFIKQDQTRLVFANRADLTALRSQLEQENINKYGFYAPIRYILDFWKRNPNERSQTSLWFLQAVNFVYVDEDLEVAVAAGNQEYMNYLVHHLIGVLSGEGDNWGKQTFAKAGFGERAPKASGDVYINKASINRNDNANIILANYLDINATDFSPQNGKYGGVTLHVLDNIPYNIEFGQQANKEFVLGNSFFYVSNAQRQGEKTTTETEGYYKLAGQEYRTYQDIPVDDQAIYNSYVGLFTNRNLRDWNAVNIGRRAGTQDATMNNWNALGMAAYAKKQGWQNLNIGQDYEWLHIQGVQNGGRNEIANLGAGTWKANSEMIPYENKIRAWANQREGRIDARYETTTNPQNSPILDRITIKVAATAEHSIGPIYRENPLEVTFNAQSGVLRDSFSNKILMKKFGDDQLNKQFPVDYLSGVQKGQQNNDQLANAEEIRGHSDYLAGLNQERIGIPVGNTLGHQQAKDDYLAGIALGKTAAPIIEENLNIGMHHGQQDYLNGYRAAKAGQQKNDNNPSGWLNGFDDHEDQLVTDQIRPNKRRK
jgi:hypothetical protein